MTPSLDRAELAARLAEADWRNPRAEPLPLGEWGRTLVAYADDLIAALAPTPAPVPPPAPTPVPEVCCASPLCPHSSPGGGTSQVGGAAERDAGIVTPASSTPAPKTKRPTHVRITGPKGQLSVTIGKVYEVLYFDDDRARLIIKNDDGVEWGLSNKPDEGPAFPTWAPAPCPPPVAGSGEKDEAARIVVDAKGVAFGKNCWISHDSITGCDAETERGRQAFYRDRVIAKQYMAWVNAMLAEQAALSRPVRP